MNLLETADPQLLPSMSQARKVTGTFNDTHRNEDNDDDPRKPRMIAHMRKIICQRDIVAHARRDAILQFVNANSGCGLALVRQSFPTEKEKTLVGDLRWLRNKVMIDYSPGKMGGTYWRKK